MKRLIISLLLSVVITGGFATAIFAENEERINSNIESQFENPENNQQAVAILQKVDLESNETVDFIKLEKISSSSGKKIIETSMNMFVNELAKVYMNVTPDTLDRVDQMVAEEIKQAQLSNTVAVFLQKKAYKQFEDVCNACKKQIVDTTDDQLTALGMLVDEVVLTQVSSEEKEQIQRYKQFIVQTLQTVRNYILNIDILLLRACTNAPKLELSMWEKVRFYFTKDTSIIEKHIVKLITKIVRTKRFDKNITQVQNLGKYVLGCLQNACEILPKEVHMVLHVGIRHIKHELAFLTELHNKPEGEVQKHVTSMVKNFPIADMLIAANK